MIVDPITKYLKGTISAILETQDRSLPVYVAGSGLFTIERIASRLGFKEIHSSDFSLPGCILGNMLSGNEIEINFTEERFIWANEHCETMQGKFATSIILANMMSFAAEKTQRDKAVLAQYEKNFPKLHAKLLAFVKDNYAGITLSSFQPIDPISFISGVPDDALLIVPPGISDFYGSTNVRLNDICAWAAPDRIPLNKNLESALSEIQKKKFWILATGMEFDDLEPKSIIKPNTSAAPINVYYPDGDAYLATPQIKIEPVGISPIAGEMDGDLSFRKVNAKQIDFLRAEYLRPTIKPSPCELNFVVLVGNELIGAVGFSTTMLGRSWDGKYLADAFMMVDFAVRPTIYKRLSKLMLVAALSTEMKTALEEKYVRQIYRIGTTVFPEHETSMKYRGLFEIVRTRDDGSLFYGADAGRWTLKEGFEWWKKKHGEKKS